MAEETTPEPEAVRPLDSALPRPAASSSPQQYAILRAKGNVSKEISSAFNVTFVRKNDRLKQPNPESFHNVADAVNRLHSQGFVKIWGGDEERWLRLFNVGHPAEDSEAANNRSTSERSTWKSKGRGAVPRAKTATELHNCAIAVFVRNEPPPDDAITDEDGGNASSPRQIALVYASAKNENVDAAKDSVHVHGLEKDAYDDAREEPRVLSKHFAPMAVENLFLEGFDRFDAEEEGRWLEFVGRANECVGSGDDKNGTYSDRIGRALGVFYRDCERGFG
mmetsp:Transcript_48431/g.103000  ORF Transcript_48431/g.103000 Transcript_48431/m.103000 type:complete len:279 (+) Transcript_48431:38-874(+)